MFGRRAFDLEQRDDAVEPGLWPLLEFEPRFRQLVEAESELFLPIMQSILMGLGLDAHLFDERLQQPKLGLRLNYYPPLSTGSTNEASRLLGHEDVDLSSGQGARS